MRLLPAVPRRSALTWLGAERAALDEVLGQLTKEAEPRIEAATQSVHQALELAHRNEDVIATIDALELLAYLERRRRSPEAAARLLGAVATARVSVGYVRPRVHAADHQALVEDLEQQLGPDELARLWSDGEQLTLADAVEFARPARGSRRRAITGWDSLSPTECRVSELVSEGLTNTQIAARLFISNNTVKTHLSAAFAKLSVTNRTELAIEAMRRSGRGGG